jgi:hypothetical protein
MRCSPRVNFGTIAVFLYINDLPLETDSASRRILYADDTSVLISGKSLREWQIKSVTALNALSQWSLINLSKQNNEI